MSRFTFADGTWKAGPLLILAASLEVLALMVLGPKLEAYQWAHTEHLAITNPPSVELELEKQVVTLTAELAERNAQISKLTDDAHDQQVRIEELRSSCR